MNKNLQDLENAIYNSIPRLRELSVGQRIFFPLSKEVGESDDGIYTIIGKDLNYKAFTVKNGEIKFGTFNEDVAENKQIEIIGHPILLNDVLECLEKERQECLNAECSKNVKLHNFLEIGKIRDKVLKLWNLPKPKLSDQSQELIYALTELIPK